MAAPQIPNLSTFRGGFRGGRGRGRGLLNRESDSVSDEAKDKIIQQTDQDASVSRLSAVQLGYMEDPFAELFVKHDAQKRFPIINRGTYVRTRAIDRLVKDFIAMGKPEKKQIISLGAGSDTRFFRLIQEDPLLRSRLLYHEIDFPANTAEKVSIITRSSKLSNIVGLDQSKSLDKASEPDRLKTDGYYLHPLDLRNLDPATASSNVIEGIDPNLPTLILSECCLVYLEPSHADNVVKYFTEALSSNAVPLGIILYEPINPQDPFGKVMVQNLAARGIVLQTLRKYGSLEAQAVRMKSYGFEDSTSMDINQLWASGSDEDEKTRIAGLEMVDEIEEWELLAAHYCVVWAWRSKNKDFWKPWG